MSKTNKSDASADIAGLNDAEIVSAVRTALLIEDFETSVRGLCEILFRADRTKTVLANELMVGGLLVSTCRNSKFSNKVIDSLPEKNRPSLRARLVIEFIHVFTLKEVEAALADCFEILMAVPEVAQSALIRVVLNGREDLFFFLTENLHDLNFDFTIGGFKWMSDQSDYTHGPKANPGILRSNDSSFETLIFNRGTTRMKDWALSRKQAVKVTN